MSELVPIALYGWIAVVLVLFSVLPARRAVIVSFIGAWLFLPQAQIPFDGLPDVTKVTVTSFAVVLGAVLFDAGRILHYRPSWVDAPIAAWCAAPIAASVANGLGVYDGLSAALDHVVTWGIPYFIGRIYFNDLAALRELAIGVFVGGLVYVPLCLLEIRLSPQLHRWVYGYHQHSFAQTIRWGGYRPTVFMQHGLMVGMWMISATLAGGWLWMSGALRALWRIPTWALTGVLLGTSVLCKSAGSLVLLLVGAGALCTIRSIRTALVLLPLVLIPPTYVALRAQGVWNGAELVALASRVNEDRAASLQGRFDNEVKLVEKALQKPYFGWGTWGRWRVADELGRDVTTADSLWIISLGRTGVVGLCAVLAVILLPVLLLMRRIGVRDWMHPAAGGAAVLAVLLVLYMMDSLLNAMLNPLFMLAAGGLSGFYVIAPRLAVRRVREPCPPPAPGPVPLTIGSE